MTGNSLLVSDEYPSEIVVHLFRIELLFRSGVISGCASTLRFKISGRL